MREVFENVLDKCLSTDEDFIGSRLCVLEASLRFLSGLTVMIEDLQSRLASHQAVKDSRHDQYPFTSGDVDVSQREYLPQVLTRTPNRRRTHDATHEITSTVIVGTTRPTFGRQNST